MTKWKIFHLEREYAHSIGDPCVCTIWANNEEDAIRKAGEDYYFPVGALAIPIEGATKDGRVNPSMYRPPAVER